MTCSFNTADLKTVDPIIFAAIEAERQRQENHIELIASENFTLPAIMEAAGSVLTNKYAEGYPEKRYYGGCKNVDIIESLAIERAKQLFGAEHVNVQPHSGTQANCAVYMAVLKPGDKILTLSLENGGHLTHGHKKNFSGILFDVVHYDILENGQIDYDGMAEIAHREKPKMITIGASAYPREIDFKRVSEIAKSCGALVLADIAHIAGLVAAKLHPSPIPYADFVTTTTHKTLRGPRGGMIMCKQEYAKVIDSAVFPGTQGGPLMHIIAAKAVCFGEALKPEFCEYQKQILLNSKTLSLELLKLGYTLASRGTDNHLMLIDLRPVHPELTGKDAQIILDSVNITTNKNSVPNETRSPMLTSGLRLGTPAVTSRGMKSQEMKDIARLIDNTLNNVKSAAGLQEIQNEVISLCSKFPLPYK